MTPELVLKSMGLLISASASMLSEDPASFANKVVERIRQSPLGKPAPVQKALSNLFVEKNGKTRVAEEIALGTLDFDLKQGSYSNAEKRKLKRISEKREILSLVPSRSLIVGNKKSGAELRVGFYLTNSVPHTQSGYTVRSHKTLTALQEKVAFIGAATRLAYPVLVGKIPHSLNEQVDGITYSRLLPVRYPRRLMKRYDLACDMLRNWVVENKIDILHTTTDYNNALVVSKVAEQLGIPWIYEARGELENTWLSRIPTDRQGVARKSEFYTAARSMESKCLRSANAVVALSNISKASMIERGVSESDIVVIRNAVDSSAVGREFEKESVLAELELSTRRKIGSVSSIVGYEGFDDLLRAAVGIPEVEVLLVGDGVEVPRLRRLAEDLGISDRVIFAGKKRNDDIWKWYAALDVFIVPRKDTEVCRKVTPVKALMAQALGIPVVTSDLPALREITGERASYVEAEAPQKLADAITDALAGPTRNKAGIDWAREHTWESNAKRYIEMYERVVAGH